MHLPCATQTMIGYIYQCRPVGEGVHGAPARGRHFMSQSMSLPRPVTVMILIMGLSHQQWRMCRT